MRQQRVSSSPHGKPHKQETLACSKLPQLNEQFPSYCARHYHTLWYGLELSMHASTATHMQAQQPLQGLVRIRHHRQPIIFINFDLDT